MNNRQLSWTRKYNNNHLLLPLGHISNSSESRMRSLTWRGVSTWLIGKYSYIGRWYSGTPRQLYGLSSSWTCADMKVPYIQCLIGQNEKKFDYINHVAKRICFRSTRVRRNTLPLSLLCISMDRSCVCVDFFSMQCFPTHVPSREIVRKWLNDAPSMFVRN